MPTTTMVVDGGGGGGDYIVDFDSGLEFGNCIGLVMDYLRKKCLMEILLVLQHLFYSQMG